MRGTDWTPEGLRSLGIGLQEHHDAGRLPFALHLAGGNEEQLIDIFSNIKEGDYVLLLIGICIMRFCMDFLLKKWKRRF